VKKQQLEEIATKFFNKNH